MIHLLSFVLWCSTARAEGWREVQAAVEAAQAAQPLEAPQALAHAHSLLQSYGHSQERRVRKAQVTLASVEMTLPQLRQERLAVLQQAGLQDADYTLEAGRLHLDSAIFIRQTQQQAREICLSDPRCSPEELMQDRDPAVTHRRKAILLLEYFLSTYDNHPQAGQARLWLAQALVEDGQYIVAQRQLDRLVTGEMGGTALLYRAQISLQVGAFASALRDFEAAAKRLPEAQARLARQQAAFCRQRLEEPATAALRP